MKPARLTRPVWPITASPLPRHLKQEASRPRSLRQVATSLDWGADPSPAGKGPSGHSYGVLGLGRTCLGREPRPVLPAALRRFAATRTTRLASETFTASRTRRSVGNENRPTHSDRIAYIDIGSDGPAAPDCRLMHAYFPLFTNTRCETRE